MSPSCCLTFDSCAFFLASAVCARGGLQARGVCWVSAGAGVQPPWRSPTQSLLHSSVSTGRSMIPFLLLVSSYPSTGDGESRCEVTAPGIATSRALPGVFQLPGPSESANAGSSSSNTQTSLQFLKQAL